MSQKVKSHKCSKTLGMVCLLSGICITSEAISENLPLSFEKLISEDNITSSTQAICSACVAEGGK